MKTFFMLREEHACPISTRDVHINVKNRQHAIDEYHYGPANPNEPGDHWDKLAEIWDISTDTAKTMKCGNCAAFDVSDRMRKCIEDGIVADDVGNNAMQTIKQWIQVIVTSFTLNVQVQDHVPFG